MDKSLLKVFVYRLAHCLPDEYACRVLPRIAIGGYVRWLVSVKQYKAACTCRLYSFLRKPCTETNVERDGRFTSIIVVAGPPRVGKSQLARALAERIGLEVIHTDDFRPIYEKISDDTLRLGIKSFLFDQIALFWPKGVILEGATFLGDDGRDERLAAALDLINRHRAKVFLVGCSESRPEEKFSILEAQADARLCWTTRLDSTQRADLARSIVKRSRMLRDLAPSLDLSYLELATADFNSDFQTPIARILATLASPSTDSESNP